MEHRFRRITVKNTQIQSTQKANPENVGMGKPKSEQPLLLLKERKTKRERWLLTRKTWRYMADAGRRLIPEGVHNRQEDIPKIEAYFQEVCQREPKFLLWRKSSYPGAISFRTYSRRTRPRKKGGSYREKASSADEAEDIKKDSRVGPNPCGSGFYMTPIGPGKFDLLQPDKHKGTEDELINELENFLHVKREGPKAINHQELIDKLQKYLQDVQNIQQQMVAKHRDQIIIEPYQKELLDTLRRHYSKSTKREAVISNLLTDRKLLEKLYFDLRKARGFRGGSGSTYVPDWGRACKRGDEKSELTFKKNTALRFQDADVSPPETHPTVEVQEITQKTKCSQTPKIHPDMIKAIEEKLKKSEEEPVKVQQKEPAKPTRRRSSLDHDDVSPSVGDTIKRYLKMARKKSIDTDKKDRFKTINYDENLRNIKAKPEVSTIGNDDGLHKGCQVGETWAKILKDLRVEDNWIAKDFKEVIEVTEAKGSKGDPADNLAFSSGSHAKSGLLSSGQLFLSNLLHGLQHADKTPISPTAMQKSKSSTSVGRNLVSKKIWRGRSKSQSRLSTTQPCSWTPQGNCVWANLVGKQVTLTDTNILQLSEIERRVLQKVALAKLQALNIGCNVQIPSEIKDAPAETKAKRRPHLLKRKAITTSFFDTNRGKEKEATSPTSSGGMVFGVALGQCIKNESLSRNASSNLSFKSKESTFPDDTDLELKRKSHHGSRTSFSSLLDSRPQDDNVGSMESLGSSVPGLLDAISVGSTADITMAPSESEPRIPNVVSSCLRHLENHGLNTLGIFRVSSSKKRVRQLRESFDSGKEISLDECCPHDVATLLKEYFRDLPEPLLCKDLYQAFIHTQKLRNRKLQFEALQHLIQLLPVSNRDTLWSLLNFLSLVAANADDHKDKCGETIPGNKMDSNNLATLFAPNILHCSSPGSVTKESLSAQSCEERIDAINVIRSMIDHNKSLFQVSAELLDDVYLHMMDTHAEALDQLLRKRKTEEGFEDPDSEAQEEVGTGSESSSLPQTPKIFADSEATTEKEERRTYSREQFLHERRTYENYEFDTGYRSRDKEKRRAAIARRARRESEGKLLSEIQNQPQENKSEDEDRNSFDYLNDGGIVKASLTIPSSFALNLDDSDIPYIEDHNNITESSKHQSSQSTVRKTTVYGSSRYSNDNDSSQPGNVQTAAGSFSFTQGTTSYDSAVGSSATYSSPPRYTATPSAGSSSDREYFSSPPSWTSSPPLSPDSQTSTYDDLSEDVPISTIGRISIPAKTFAEIPNSSTAEKEEAEGDSASKSVKKLEKTKEKKITKTSETRKSQGESEKKPDSGKLTTKDLYQRVHSLVGGSSAQSIPDTLTKSASSSQLLKKGDADNSSTEWSRKVTTSISNIGGAVMKSKTADIERMLKIKPEVKKTKMKAEIKATAKTEFEKKYSRRRYTDSRHSTKTIPDLNDKSVASQPQKSQSIWKRREIISSPPKGGEDF